jgi:signal transduction histidine kinase
MVTSLPPAESAIPTPVAIGELHARLTAGGTGAIPLLIVRLPALERTAWREGLRKARTLERRACAAFAAAAAGVLRADDRIAHDAGSDVFVAALTAPTRGCGEGALPIDARSALARICARIESATRLNVEAGWTTVAADDRADLSAAIERGLVRGAQERERYAFFSALGHELRTPLSSIRGYLETLLDDEIDARTRRRFLAIAHQESLRLARLVDGMFEISLLDLQPAGPVRSNAALGAAVEAAADACAAGAAARAITVQRPVLPPVNVQIDPDRLTLVLINLIENAVKHGRSGGSVSVGVEFADTTLACVTIDDDGPGVKPADRERIFALGARGETQAPGSGIGLALVRLLVERAGGRVDVVASPRGGARMRVFLRRAA